MQKSKKQESCVLVVETDDLIRDLLVRWLKEEAYLPFLGSSENQPTSCTALIVVVNLSSPKASEPLIRSLRSTYAAPILALSARFTRGLGNSSEAARALGVDKVLPKPFTREEFLVAVRELVESSGAI